LNSATNELQTVSEKVTAERAQLVKLQEDTAQTRATLTQLQQEAKDVSESIQIAETFIQLLYEPGTINDLKILKMNDLLQQVLKARADVRRLPIDYKGLKDAFRDLLETVLGDKLLPRDRLDREMGMIRRGWAELHSRERELAIDLSVLDNATWAQLLVTAIGEIRKGRLFLGRCKECKSIAAVRRGNRSHYHSQYKCPLCWHSLEPRELPQMKQVSA
jgi:hypothetical protein